MAMAASLLHNFPEQVIMALHAGGNADEDAAAVCVPSDAHFVAAPLPPPSLTTALKAAQTRSTRESMNICSLLYDI